MHHLHRMLNHIGIQSVKSNQSTNWKQVLTDSWSTFPECPSRIKNIQEVRGLAKAEHWHHLSHIFSHLKQDKFNLRNSSPESIQRLKARREGQDMAPGPQIRVLTDDSGTELFRRLASQCCGSGSGRIRNFWPDPDPIRNRNKRFGSGLNPDSNPYPKLDPKKICKKEHYFQAKIRWFHIIIHISHLQVVATIAVQ